MMDDAKAYELAGAAQRAWLCQGAPLQMVWRSENIVFATVHGSGAKLALRLHRPGYQDPAAIACELAWCAKLADAGVAVVEPLPAASGAWVAQVQGMTASCLRWISGKPLGAADEKLEGSAVLERAEDLGALLAHLHNAADAGACPSPFPRAAWDQDALLGPAPRLGPFWENPTLSAEESTLLQQAREKAALMLPRATDYGPIHADVLRSNVMVEAGKLRLIDFDDCGPGWRLYDLATVLIQSWGDPLLGEHARRLVAGYRKHRALPDDQLELLPLFLSLRAFSSAGWVVTRAAQDPKRQRSYARRAVELARLLLKDAAPWEGVA
ncbi:Ser/Thr protein kinase RdoA (MazF antagonist) [Rhodobacter aestuarii]|uniref:Ser/Thr protein kinase RdoA involved in Cpx stress response, MazF antagonist n=1 Tax=Rhodobacter aestuarii TaxID=453582 RepID=A0A1N7LP69_9RHOB|nr:phosphotransferase [Rhodobacter aestuarii]PTV95121.1 Ser/Thr protein kinase RdoA (MazF antagonist) [Rhodobacter aestuarii]SIS75653.1 Ser/Thr protein kinase RdoA involved in Cpx stress response, MazF antagonist [Rhodobacter aestuarii]